ncbi:MAG: hypothetical protein IT427_14625 [Pirellulales bacterium]|nr:hypothetical protein [Pirellulales bacterium]
MAEPKTPQQTTIEHEALKHITSALRTVMDWHPSGDEVARKLSSLRFIAESFQRHLERLMALKEQDGYLANAIDEKPNLAEKANALLLEHDRFDESLHRLLLKLEQISATDKQAIDAACRDLEELLIKLDDHHRREAALMQEAFLRDEGGHG